jgi:hypothetical protein
MLLCLAHGPFGPSNLSCLNTALSSGYYRVTLFMLDDLDLNNTLTFNKWQALLAPNFRTCFTLAAYGVCRRFSRITRHLSWQGPIQIKLAGSTLLDKRVGDLNWGFSLR